MDIHSSKLALFETFLTEFRSKDTNFTGEVTEANVRATMTEHTKLSNAQVDQLLQQAGKAEDGTVNYRTFARVAAQTAAEAQAQPAVSPPPPASVTADIEEETEGDSAPSQGDLLVRRKLEHQSPEKSAPPPPDTSETPEEGLAALARQANALMAGPPNPMMAGSAHPLRPPSGWLPEPAAALPRLHPQVRQNMELRSQASTNQAQNAELETRCGMAEEEIQRVLHENGELQAANEDLHARCAAQQEQIELLAAQNDSLKNQLGGREQELAEMRGPWQEREKRLEQLESQRVFYEESLARIGDEYQGLLDKLSFVVTDYSVRTAPIQVRVGGGYELLSTFLNRIFEDQEKLKQQYDKVVPHAPHLHLPRASSPTKKTQPNRARCRSMGASQKLKSPMKPYEPLRTQEISWARGLRSPSPARNKSPSKRQQSNN
eukprot:TRINITY_DN60506_c0_g1_i3.p1 TRINITY_DN60506_c0_g1~~TRINITY_DN60506_c0_g1_i3.p1  ORF type:complete len:433 (+),score=123.43 TRINITY_DN60506_c0_g1_i3:240-1538(+)